MRGGEAWLGSEAAGGERLGAGGALGKVWRRLAPGQRQLALPALLLLTEGVGREGIRIRG